MNLYRVPLNFLVMAVLVYQDQAPPRWRCRDALGHGRMGRLKKR